jgi:hypothetical protein
MLTPLISFGENVNVYKIADVRGVSTHHIQRLHLMVLVNGGVGCVGDLFQREVLGATCAAFLSLWSYIYKQSTLTYMLQWEFVLSSMSTTVESIYFDWLCV